METIIRESARYTSNGKPLSRASVFRLLAEMENAGAIKTEARFSEATGRQRSSYRYLVTSVAVPAITLPALGLASAGGLINGAVQRKDARAWNEAGAKIVSLRDAGREAGREASRDKRFRACPRCGRTPRYTCAW